METSTPAISETPHQPPPPPAQEEPAAAVPMMHKKPLHAALLSAMPGMGHIYNGLYGRGVIFFLVVAALMSLADNVGEMFVFPMFFVWIFNTVDAVRQAKLINYGYAQDFGLVDRPRPRSDQGRFFIGLALVVFGVWAILEQHYDIDYEWLADLWPAALIVIGLWFIWTWFRDKKNTEALDPQPDSAES